MIYPPTNLIEATGLADAWAQAVKYVLKNGAIIGTQYGNRSKDICSVIEIKQPYLTMLHPQFPTKELHCKEYIKQWERDYDWKAQGFEYIYMDRLTNYPATPEYRDPGTDTYYHHYLESKFFIDQLKVLRTKIPKETSRRHQAITWIPDRDLFVEEDQPCLQRLWFRNLTQGNVEMHCMWRSRDLFSGWNSNMIGLLTMVKKEILEPNNLRLIKVVDFCNSLHIYEADWEEAALVQQIPVNPQIRGRI